MLIRADLGETVPLSAKGNQRNYTLHDSTIVSKATRFGASWNHERTSTIITNSTVPVPVGGRAARHKNADSMIR